MLLPHRVDVKKKIKLPQKMSYFQQPNERTFSVRFLSPTNHRGARVKITDLVRCESVTLGYDYAESYIYEQAAGYLNKRGISDLRLCLNNSLDCYLMTSPNFETSLK